MSLAWTPPLNLSADPDVTDWCDIAAACDGTLHAVWTNRTTHLMKYASRPLGGSWSAPVDVGSYANITIFADGDITVGVAPDGTVHILYADDSSGNSEIYHRSKPPGGVWSAPVNISQTPGTRSEFPDVAVSPDGTVHAVWIDATPSNGFCCGETYYASLAPGGSWTPAINVSNSGPNEYETRVGVGPDNSVHVITAQEDGGPGQQNIYYYTKPQGGAFGPGQNLTGAANIGRNMGGVLKTADGTVHVVYYEGNPAEVIYQNKSPCSGTWSGPLNISNDASSSGNPTLAADACGNVHVAWVDDGAGGRIMYSGRTTFGTWSPPVDISGGAPTAHRVSVAVGVPRGNTTGMVEVLYLSSPSGNSDNFFTESALSACSVVIPLAVSPPGDATVGGEIRVIPNPTAGRVRLEARVAGSTTSITIHDMAGRLVRVLRLSSRTSGWAEVEWDGREESGREAPAGVYWAQVGSRKQETGARVVLVR